MISFTLQPLRSEKKLPVPIVYEAGWAPEPVWTLSWREIIFSSGFKRNRVIQR
jgi:hypothetical protein